MIVAVIGGGPAGMMAALSAADHGAEVLLLEQNEKLGKKLYITGKGRCNLTNACPVEDFFGNVVTNPKFLYSAIYSFTNEDLCRLMEQEGLKLKEERGKRVFPASDKSSDVIRTMENALRRRGVKIRLHSKVTGLQTEDGIVRGVFLENKAPIRADAVILATGGLSYPSTGSTGDGYRFARETGHTLTELRPSLVALKVRETYVARLEGLSLRNVRISMDRFQEFGEMLFTADGVSGPLILSASARLCGRIAQKEEMILHIDLKPALDPAQLDARILRDFGTGKNKDFRNCLASLLPAKLLPVILELSNIPEHKKVNEITREERKHLAELLKDFRLTVTGTKGFEQAVITQGGVCVKDIVPATMESRRVKGLYFAGEVIDTDAFTGGFNLQIAWSTGHLAGASAAEGNH
ncbi:MAG: NAD(P)/FAD-dependent oxidoreductase [Parasporobacterium sp.]|nr:NAD(P)/FAD-dependent oxidoreductase [Parasporobacterium sp.]